MANYRGSKWDDDEQGNGPPTIPGRGSGGGFDPRKLNMLPTLVAVVLIGAILYGGYFWFVRRVVVGPDQVLVLLRKDAGKSLPGDQVIIPRPPKPDSPEYKTWDETYGDCNGIVEQVYLSGTY